MTRWSKLIVRSASRRGTKRSAFSSQNGLFSPYPRPTINVSLGSGIGVAQWTPSVPKFVTEAMAGRFASSGKRFSLAAWRNFLYWAGSSASGCLSRFGEDRHDDAVFHFDGHPDIDRSGKNDFVADQASGGLRIFRQSDRQGFRQIKGRAGRRRKSFSVNQDRFQRYGNPERGQRPRPAPAH